MNRTMLTMLTMLTATGLLVVQGACSDHETGETHAAGGGGATTEHGSSSHATTSTTATTTTSSGSTSASSGSGGGGAVMAPSLTSVEPLAGGLHVTWVNVTADCDAVELDRKKDDGAYAVAYTLTGAAESQHDDVATAPGTYCYKLRCIRGDETSPDSNEECGTP